MTHVHLSSRNSAAKCSAAPEPKVDHVGSASPALGSTRKGWALYGPMCPRPMPNCGSECNKRIENLKQLGTCLDRRTWKAKRVDDWQRRRWPPPSPPQQQEQQQQRTHTHKPGLTQAPLTAQSLSHMPSARLPPWKNDQIYKKKSKINNTKIELFLGVRFQNNETVQLLKVVVMPNLNFFQAHFYKLIRLNASASSIYFLHFAFMFLLLVFMSFHFNCMSFHFGDPRS